MKLRCPLRRKRAAFTLIELLVVIALIGILMGLLLPAVQMARESARKVNCQSHMKQQGLALQNFHATHNRFPAGDYGMNDLHHSWGTYLLPFLEQDSLAAQIDLSRPWNDETTNLAAASTILPVFRCPSGPLEFPGDIDYGGILGSTLTGMPLGTGRHEALGSGVMVRVNEKTPGYIGFRDITDGASNTICIAESSDRVPPAGMWAAGFNLMAQDETLINTRHAPIIASYHPQGAYAVRADGSVMFLSVTIDMYTLGALCTRNGGEVVVDP